MFQDVSVDPRSLLAQVCNHEPFVTSVGKELLRRIPFQRWDSTAGRRVPTTALLVSIDNGNDAFKGALLHAHQPFLHTRRMVTAYAPAKAQQSEEGITTWQVNDSEPFWIGNDALLHGDVESLPIGMTEDRLPDERFRRYLFACLVEVLQEAGYDPSASEASAEYDLYVSVGVPN